MSLFFPTLFRFLPQRPLIANHHFGQSFVSFEKMSAMAPRAATPFRLTSFPGLV